MTKRRCDWCNGNHLYENYHDIVWGVPVFEDNILFESLTLEIFQSGLSWITILKKREGFIKAFDSFDIYKIASYDIKKEKELIANTSIIRNNLKIKATINNAKAIIKIQEEHNSFSKYIWNYVNNDPIINKFKSLNEVPNNTPLAEKICIDLKKKGFKFIGPTIIYSFMQAIGMTNDHLIYCFCHPMQLIKKVNRRPLH
ncbi:MAG: DNA-3-methyladenine glycosylase I [Flavobacteriaceae bacterium]|nr:DNA-3-methyladenine glycosylase I [Flavobacteriaceae bacterium]|tara:strand:+ start:4670 stop:5266 length:597 start_codon:yes stop_codon:yes gene_type:complete